MIEIPSDEKVICWMKGKLLESKSSEFRSAFHPISPIIGWQKQIELLVGIFCTSFGIQRCKLREQEMTRPPRGSITVAKQHRRGAVA